MYIQYNMNQTCLPLEMDALLPHDHIVFLIHEEIEKLSDQTFQLIYNDFGRPSYHPKVLLKTLLFAYTEKVFSGRRIEKMMKENLPMQWLASQHVISYRTMNRFRSSETMAALIKDLYCSFSSRLKTDGLISQEAVFIDGTKFEANANKYSFVWKKATDRYYKKLKQKEINYYEQEITPTISKEIKRDHEEAFSTEEVYQLKTLLEEEFEKTEEAIEDVDTIQKKTKDEKETMRQLKKKKRKLKKHHKQVMEDFIPREEKYHSYYETFKGRNSFSKTDTDATFMRMKDDPMRNGQLKAGYNVQIATENQFVLHTQVYPNPADTTTFIPFMESFPKELLPTKWVVADAGYGSQENLEYLEHQPFGSFVKYGKYEKEQKKSFQKSDKNLNNWLYKEDVDAYIHPDGTRYDFGLYKTRKTSTGYKQVSKVYQSTDPTYQNGKKSLYINESYHIQKQKMKEKLSSDLGQSVYAQRKIDVEPAFGQAKANLGYSRLALRGKENVENEIRLIFMANNLRKYINRTRE